MRRHPKVVAALLVVLTGASLSADRIRLRSGKVIEGIYIGGDSKTVKILLDNGSVSQVPIEETTAVEFSVRKPPPPPPPPPPAPPAPARAVAPKP